MGFAGFLFFYLHDPHRSHWLFVRTGRVLVNGKDANFELVLG